MANVGTVTFDVAAEVAKLRTDLEKVRKDVSGLRKTGADMGDAISSGFKTAQRALGLFGVAFGAAALTQGMLRVAGSAIEMGDEIGKAATKAGIAASTMSELAYAARMNDVDITALSTSLRKMQETTSLAAAGNKAATATVQSLGLSVEQLRALQPDQQFEAFAQAISTLPDPADRARLAVDVFGRAGAELLPLMEQGAAGVRLLREEAKTLGVALSDEQVKRLQDADDAIKRLKASFSSLATTLVAEAAPALSRFFDNLRVSLAGTELEKLQRDIRGIEAALKFQPAGAGGDEVVRRQMQERLAVLRQEERVLKERAKPPKSLAETRGSRPLAIGVQDVSQPDANAKKGKSAVEQWLETRGGAGAGSRMAGQAGATRQVMRNGQLVDESTELGAGMDALGNEVQLEAQRVLNEQLLDLEREFTAGKVTEVQNRQSILASLVQESEATQNAYRFAAYQSWTDILAMGVSAAAAGNKRLAKIQQGFAIANVIWSTGSAIMDVMGPRGPGFPANIAAAAKIAAMGAIQLSKIKSATYSEGGGGGGSIGGVSGESGGAVQDRAGARAPEQEVQAARPQATIVVQGNIYSTRESAEWFIEQIRDAVVDRDVVLIPSNSRQALELAGVGS